MCKHRPQPRIHEKSNPRPTGRSMGARPLAGLLIGGLLIIGTAACEPEPGDDVGAQEGTDTVEMGTDREEPIVPPTEGDTGMLGRDTTMAGQDTVQLRGPGDTASGDTARGRTAPGGESDSQAGGEDRSGQRDAASRDESATRSAAAGEEGEPRGDVEDTLAAVRPQPADGENGGAAVDPETLEQLESLIDETVRDLQRAQELLRQAMGRSGTERDAGDTTTASSRR